MINLILLIAIMPIMLPLMILEGLFAQPRRRRRRRGRLRGRRRYGSRKSGMK